MLTGLTAIGQPTLLPQLTNNGMLDGVTACGPLPDVRVGFTPSNYDYNTTGSQGQPHPDAVACDPLRTSCLALAAPKRAKKKWVRWSDNSTGHDF